MRSTNDILSEILELNRKAVKLQEEINRLVKEAQLLPDEDELLMCIESYYISNPC
jgi:hypothetical protein